MVTQDNASARTFLRPAVAADYIGLSVSTLNKLRLKGGGPEFCKLGRAVVYRRDVLDQWVNARARRSTSQAAA